MLKTTIDRAELPAPVYAAAGATDLAVQQLRRLPEYAVATIRFAGTTAGELRQRIGNAESGLVGDWAKVRDSAQRGTATMIARAASLQERAAALQGRAATLPERAAELPARAAGLTDRLAAGYRGLVARGERLLTEETAAPADESEPVQVEVEVGPVQPAQPTG